MNDLTAVNEQITTHFGGEHRPEVFKRMADREALLRAAWNQYLAVMGDGELDIRTKELMGLCVAMAKPNEYMIGLQQRRIRRVGIDDAAEKEAIAVAGFFEGFNGFAHALRVDSDVRFRRMDAGDMSLVDREVDVTVPHIIETQDPIVVAVYQEIAAKMGVPFIPNIFKVLAHQPAMLKAKWECYQAIMLDGVLQQRTKELLALAVSAVNSCDYCVDAHSTVARQLGLSERGLVEAAAVVDLFTGLCTVAKGYRLTKRNF